MDYVGSFRITAIEEVQHAKTQKTHGSDRKPHDRATVKRNGQRLRCPSILRCRRRPDIGLGGRVHTDKASGSRTQRPNKKRNHRAPAEI